MASLIEVERLGRKVRLFRAALEIATDDELSKMLGAGSTTLSGWVERSRLPNHALERLAQIFVARHRCEVTLDEARALWHGPYDAFEGALFRRPVISLLSALREVEPKLGLRLIPFERGFSMVGDCYEGDENVTEISFNAEYCFELDVQPGMRLMVFCADTKCWRLLAPGRRHSGLIQNHPEIFPPPGQKRLWFEDKGLHQFVFVEHPVTLKPVLPDVHSLSPLDAWHLDQFAHQLASPAWQGKWRWAEVMYKVA